MLPNPIRAVLLGGAILVSCTDSAPSSSITLTAVVPNIALPQGGAQSVGITLTRRGFDGAVSFTVIDLPEGVSATFDPPTLSEGATGTTLTLSAASAAPAGATTFTVMASGVGVDSRSLAITVTVTVTGSFSLAASPSTIELVRDDRSAAIVSVLRTDGFAQPVSVAVSGLPAGVTATVSDALSASAIVAFSASASAALGDVVVTITGTSPGVTQQTATLTVSVRAAPSLEAVSLDFCSGGVPVWMAFRNQGNDWTQLVADANGTVTFDAAPKISLAFVTAVGQLGTKLEIRHLARSELDPMNGVECYEPGSATTAYAGSLSGLPSMFVGRVSMGPATQFRFADATTFRLNVPSGTMDLVATRSPEPTAWITDRLVIRRNVVLPATGEIEPIEFESTAAVVPATPTITITGPNPTQTLLLLNTVFARSSTSTATTSQRLTSTVYLGAPRTIAAMPVSHTTPDDEQYLRASESGGRGTAIRYRQSANMTLHLLAELAAPTFSAVANAPYARHRVQLAAGPYTGSVQVLLGQSGRSHTMYVSAAHLGIAPTTWDLTMPDLSGAPGWDNAWGMQPGLHTTVAATAYTPGLRPFSEDEQRARLGQAIHWAHNSQGTETP